MFCIVSGAVYLFGGSIAEACAHAWGPLVIVAVVAQSVERWPDWRNNDGEILPVIIGVTLVAISIKILELLNELQ